MSQPAHFQQVITKAIVRNSAACTMPHELAAKIIEALDIADDILGDAPTQTIQPAKPSVLIKTPEPAYKSVDLSKGLIIGTTTGEEAPPTAVIRNPEGVAEQESPEEIERKKSLLNGDALAQLPLFLKFDLPALGREIVLQRFVQLSPAGMNFIRVRYAQVAEEENGPQIQLSTAAPNFDAKAIIADIKTQAEMRYRKDRIKIEPRTPPPAGMPDPELMLSHDPRNSVGADEKVSQADWDDWQRGSQKT